MQHSDLPTRSEILKLAQTPRRSLWPLEAAIAEIEDEDQFPPYTVKVNESPKSMADAIGRRRQTSRKSQMSSGEQTSENLR